MSETSPYKEGFESGYRQLKGYALINGFDIKAATLELWQALGINNRNTFLFYKKGKIECKASQAVAVELVFRKYGITTSIWGK